MFRQFSLTKFAVKEIGNVPPAESDATEGLHSDAGPDGDVDRRLLAHGVAGAGLVHRHGHQVRFHNSVPKFGECLANCSVGISTMRRNFSVADSRNLGKIGGEA